MSQNLGIKIRNVTNQKNALNQTKIKKLYKINTIKFQKNTRELFNKALEDGFKALTQIN